MIQQLEISSVHEQTDEALKKYVTKKIGGLDKYIPRHARKSAAAEVFLRESQSKGGKQHSCEVNLSLPEETINAKEATMNMYAAVDIVTAKLKNQIKSYKETHISHKAGRKDSKVRAFLGKIGS